MCAYCSMKSYLGERIRKSPSSPLFVDPIGCILNKANFTQSVRLLLAINDIDPSKFTAHSFRAGSATQAADNELNDYEIKQLGRWSSSAYQLYLRNPKSVSNLACKLIV